MKVASMNEGDVFILDTGTELYQWNGTAPRASRQPPAAAAAALAASKTRQRQH